MVHVTRTATVCLLLAAVIVGCTRNQPQVAPAEPPAVPVSQPVRREVTDYVDFTGRTAAVESVRVVPRATGYLVAMPFKEGAEIKKGDLLFQIDPRPYQAQLDQTVGQAKLYEAELKLADANLARGKELLGPKAISQSDFDALVAAQAEAVASLNAARASTEVYKLNLEFTRVTAPIDGQVSRYYLTLGNLVTQDQTLLTTIVSLDPMYAYFDVDEPTVLRVRKAINEGRIKPHESGQIPVLMGLQGEEGFPRRGMINFVDNQVNPTTGSILVRGMFGNPLPPHGRRLLLPGMFVRIRLPIGQPHSALLVIDRAIASDQGLKYVYVVGPDNKADYRRIETGSLESNGLRVISDGLKPEDWIVVGGLQLVRSRLAIQPDKTPMPALDSGPDAKTPSAENK